MATVTELETRTVWDLPTHMTVHHTEPNGTTSRPSLSRQPEEIDFETPARTDAEAIEQQQPPADSGPAAYRFLFGAFMIEAFQWGFALSFGVFQNFYSSHPPFLGNKNIAVIGTLGTGVFYLVSPLMTPLVKRWPQYRRQMIWFGWTINVLSLVAASFATTIGVLIATQGVLYSVGFTIMYFPIISMLNEWFVARRGLAFGIITAATGLSGVALPFVLAILLDSYGFPTTLRAFAVALVVLTGPVLPTLKGRLPAAHASSLTRINWSFLRNSLSWFFATSVLLQGLGYFCPTLYLPSYANSLGYSPNIGALLLALFSVMQAPGQVGIGYLSDKRVSVEMLAFLAPLVSAISILLLWGLSRSLPPLIIFSLLYGFFGSGYVVLWAKMGLRVSEDPTVALVTFGAFCFLKGVGNVITGPISAGLILQQTDIARYGLGKYKWVISYSGACMLACVGTMIVLFVGRRLSRNAWRRTFGM